MFKARKSLKVPRTLSFAAQNGHCYYCHQPMWESGLHTFITKYSISTPQANLLRCTGEHLLAHKDGGTSKSDNIVAACHYCNYRRHWHRKKEILPAQYRALVLKRLAVGRWHGLNLVEAA